MRPEVVRPEAGSPGIIRERLVELLLPGQLVSRPKKLVGVIALRLPCTAPGDRRRLSSGLYECRGSYGRVVETYSECEEGE
jgi:hypothetical protein